MLQIDNRYQELNKFVREVCTGRPDDEQKATLRKFAAVLICGFVERSVEIVVLERLRNRAQPQVLAFIKSHFKRGTNYDCAAIGSLLERFDGEWKARFERAIQSNEAASESLKSIYSVRNSVAHGGTMGIGSSTLQQRFFDAKIVVDALIDATR
ncbi:HEPN domain-containing protein [Amaricoccus solimangrovi]|uniref:RiboL-PSP-HEPN domain-containing protein n=1 Tax=Amaricoccus solimangrovi TaxID=2589815 RepID=A0A501WWJ0_9RHOB|nr:HEPN domain-containing protein [Amaricoccus solimangrovi]TPE53639.1 hypothetical protein FJM51_00895 [Amaricoccus solimangrovi]